MEDCPSSWSIPDGRLQGDVIIPGESRNWAKAHLLFTTVAKMTMSVKLTYQVASLKCQNEVEKPSPPAIEEKHSRAEGWVGNGPGGGCRTLGIWEVQGCWMILAHHTCSNRLHGGPGDAGGR